MTKGEIFANYVLPVLAAAVTALAGFLGAQLKGLYQKYINDKIKEAVVRTCVKAVEQLYHDLSGPEKLEKAKDGVVEMLNEKGIPISDLEMNLLIEAVVSEFNYGFAKAGEVSKSDTPAVVGGDSSAAPQNDKENAPQNDSPAEYSEEEGASL